MLIGNQSFRVVGVLRMKEFSQMFGNSGQEEDQRAHLHPHDDEHALHRRARRASTTSPSGYARARTSPPPTRRSTRRSSGSTAASRTSRSRTSPSRSRRPSRASSRSRSTWNMILSSIATVSLLVGGIGLLSVLIISVNERLREIGIRKAVGAEDRAIFQQFIIESVTISVVGGLRRRRSGSGTVQAHHVRRPTRWVRTSSSRSRHRRRARAVVRRGGRVPVRALPRHQGIEARPDRGHIPIRVTRPRAQLTRLETAAQPMCTMRRASRCPNQGEHRV